MKNIVLFSEKIEKLLLKVVALQFVVMFLSTLLTAGDDHAPTLFRPAARRLFVAA